jgi:hypothetical protein
MAKPYALSAARYSDDYVELLVGEHLSKINSVAVLRIGIRSFLTPGSGMGKNSGSGIRIRDEQPGSYFRELRNNTYTLMRIRDTRWKNSDSGVGWEKFGSGMEKNLDPG